MKKTNLLIVEDEEAIRDMLRFSLKNTDFIVWDAKDVAHAMQTLTHHIPDVMVLDWMLPDKSGIDFIKWIRKEPLLKSIPIIMLTAKAEEENKIKGLMSGADDYITKPFSIDELIARIKTVLRRGLLVSPDNQINIADMIINIDTHSVHIDNQPITLFPIEYKLLYFFATHPNKVYSRDELISHVYGRDVYIDDRSIDVQIKRLREKLKPHDYDTLIKTVRGAGYSFTRDKNEKRT